MVVHAIERPQILDADVFNIAAIANGGITVVVPRKSRCENLCVERALWAVLAHFEFVANDRHLSVELFAQDVGIDHAVRFHFECPLQVGFVRGEALVVVGAVEPRRAVVDEAAIGHVLPQARVFRRGLEQHVFEQMRHASFAVAFVSRAHEIGDVYRHLRARRIGEQQHAQTV